MKFVKLLLRSGQNGYIYKEASSIALGILGLFLTDDVGCYSYSSFREWVLDNTQTDASINATYMEKEDDYILLSNIHPFKKKPEKLKLSCAQLVQLLDDWKEKVCEKKPKEVIIKHEDGRFIIETKD